MVIQNPSRTLVTNQYGAPQMYCMAPRQRQNGAYRRLAAAILGVDNATLTRELRKRNFARQATRKAA